MSERLWDPYNQNIALKADRPLFDECFINLAVVSDTLYELRTLPTRGAVPFKRRTAHGASNVFGDVNQSLFNENLLISVSSGSRATRRDKPQDFELRVTALFNFNYTAVEERRILHIDPGKGLDRTDRHTALQEAFIDYHIRNVSDRFDFDSIRVGIQPITADFRGFLFLDEPLGVRFFGTRSNNIFQYNLGWFRRCWRKTLTQTVRKVIESI